ncbi:MAG: FAD-dependent oxidoreductase, partial [Chthoniobacterales bacterium]
MMKSVDVAIIGGGSAGYAAARTAVSEGLETLVIEGGAEVGGLCILRGCMPSKALIESANRFRTLQRAREFGLSAESISADTVAI